MTVMNHVIKCSNNIILLSYSASIREGKYCKHFTCINSLALMILEVGIAILTGFQMCELGLKVFIFQGNMLVITELINGIQCSPKTRL